MAQYRDVDFIEFLSGGPGKPIVRGGAVDPRAGAGVAAPEGSIFQRNVAGAGEVYWKAGAADTAWFLLGAGGGGAQILTWGNFAVGLGSGDVFIPYGYGTAEGATAPLGTDVYPLTITVPGTFDKLYGRHNLANGGAARTVTYEFLLNGTPTGLAIVLATGVVAAASDLVHSFAVVEGDLVSLRATKAGLTGSGAVEFTCATRFRAT